MPSRTFGSPGNLPWNHRFTYHMTNMDVPRDHRFFVTVVYGSNDDANKYLHHWMHNHPALKDMKTQVNYREITTNDPIYRSYLNVSVTQTPAVLITTPPSNGPFGKTVYLAYGDYLPTDPNDIATQMESAMQHYSQTYTPETIQQVPPTVPEPVEPVVEPVVTPSVVQPQPEPKPVLGSAADGINIVLLVAILVVLLKGKR